MIVLLKEANTDCRKRGEFNLEENKLEPVPINYRLKSITLENGKSVSVKTFFGVQLYKVYAEIEKKEFGSQKEWFWNLVKAIEVIDGFAADDYMQLSDNDLLKIAEIIRNSEKIEIDLNEDDIYLQLHGELANKIKNIKETITTFASTWADIRPVIDVSSLGKVIVELGEGIRKNLVPIFSNIQAVTTEWAKTIGNFIKEHEKYLEAKEKASLIATKYDWFVTTDYYSNREFFSMLIELDESNPKPEDIDALFINYYDTEIRTQMMNDLRSFDALKDFEAILEQIEVGYDQRLFYLIVPAILVTIEGMVARGFKHKGNMGGSTLTGYINTLIGSDNEESLQQVISTRMYARFEHGSELDSPMSRHAILHGGDIRFGTEAVALRLFLILFNLAFALECRETINSA